MTNSFDLFFYNSDKKSLSSYQLSKDGEWSHCEEISIDELAENNDAKPIVADEPILILPASRGLPFQLELPFGEEQKINRILPQAVADIFSSVDENWLFSWKKKLITNDAEAYTSFKIAGLAYPPEFKRIISDCGISWRLVVAETEFLPLSEEKAGFIINSINKESYAVAVEYKNIKRLLGEPESTITKLALRKEGIAQLKPFRFAQEGKAVFEKALFLTENPENIDLSGWSQNRFRKAKLMVAGTLLSLLVFVAVAWHFFLWIECLKHEAAGRRTQRAMLGAFSKVFPGIPVVDPVNQLARKKDSLIKELSFSKEYFYDSFLPAIRLSTELGNRRFLIHRIKGKNELFSVAGISPDYSALNKLKSELAKKVQVSQLRVTETRKISEGIKFRLEAKWND